MTKITAKEFKVLEVFAIAGMECNGTNNAEDLKADNMTWTMASEIRQSLRWKAEAVAAVMGSLQNKGLAIDSGEPREGKKQNDWYLSDAGIDAYFAHADNAEELPEEIAEEEAEEAAAPEAEGVEGLLVAYGYTQPRNLCRAIRGAAREWRNLEGSRKSFIEGCAALGLNPANAAAEWQASTKRAD